MHGCVLEFLRIGSPSFSLPLSLPSLSLPLYISPSFSPSPSLSPHPPQVPGDTEVPLMERLFSVGQLMPCYVQAVEKGGRISLSVSPELVNSHLSAKDVKPKLVC